MTRRTTLALIVGLALLWLLGLGASPLFDVDEGAFAEASREMLVSGDWLHTTLNGADRFDKPILVYWLQALSLAVFGINEFAVRLPSALCALLTGLAAWRFLAPRFGMRSGALTPWLLATALGPMVIGRAATADALLGLLLVLACFALWRCLEADDSATARGALRWAAVWVGLGFLAKGPVAIVVPGAAAVLWCLSQARAQWGGYFRRLLGDGPAWLILIAVAAPWYAYAMHRHGRAFIEGFLLKHNLDRFTGPLEGHSGSLGYFIVALPLLLLPWSALLWPVLRRVRSLWHEPLPRFLLLWAGFVIVFFSLSGTKLPHYALYGVVPLAALAARELSRGVGAGVMVGVGLGVVAVLAIGLASPWLAERAAALPALDAHGRERFAAFAGSPISPLLWGAVALALGGLAWAAKPVQRDLGLTAAAVAAALSLAWVVLPWWGAGMQGPVRELALRARSADLPLVQWRLHQPSVGFYRQQPAPLRAPGPGEVALGRSDRLAQTPPEERAGWVELAREGGFVLVLNKP